MADEAATKRWMAYFRSQGVATLAVDCKSGRGCNQFNGAIRELLSDLVEKWESKGAHRAIRAMIVGIPNVGKSSFINRMNKGGKIYFSGFYESDLPMIKAEAERLGLHYVSHRVEKEWTAAMFRL